MVSPVWAAIHLGFSSARGPAFSSLSKLTKGLSSKGFLFLFAPFKHPEHSGPSRTQGGQAPTPSPQRSIGRRGPLSAAAPRGWAAWGRPRQREEQRPSHQGRSVSVENVCAGLVPYPFHKTPPQAVPMTEEDPCPPALSPLLRLEILGKYRGSLCLVLAPVGPEISREVTLCLFLLGRGPDLGVRVWGLTLLLPSTSCVLLGKLFLKCKTGGSTTARTGQAQAPQGGRAGLWG